MAPLAIALLVGPRPAAAHPPPFDYDAFFELIGLLALSLAAPEYSLTFDGHTVHNGLIWEVPGGVAPFGGVLAVAYYPGSEVVTGRATFHLRLVSLVGFDVFDDCCPDAPQYRRVEQVRLGVGLGSFVESGVAAGPRAEVRLTGFLTRWLQLFAAAAYEPDVTGPVAHRLEFRAGLQIPYSVDPEFEGIWTGEPTGSRWHFF